MTSVFTALALAAVALLPGATVDRTLSPGQAHTFEVEVPAGHAVHAIVEQGERDLVVRIVRPDGTPLATFDARERAGEMVSFVAPVNGTYRIIVAPTSPGGARAPYTLRLEPPRPAAADDRRRIEAAAAGTDAKQLAARGGRESLMKAVERLERARALWQEAALAAPALGALTRMGDALYALSEYPRAEQAWREALALARQQADWRTEFELLNNLGLAAWRQGDMAALDLLAEAIAGWQRMGFRYGHAAALNNRALVLREVGEYDQAKEHFRSSADQFRAIGDRRGEALALTGLGGTLDDLGESAQALARFRRAAGLFRDIGDRLSEGRSLVWQARIQLALGARQSALINAERGLALVRQAGNPLAEADALRYLGRILAPGDRVAARGHFERALDLYLAAGSRRGQADALHEIGLGYMAGREYDRAVTSFENALSLRQAIGVRRLEADSHFRLAQARRQLGDDARARAHLETAIELVERVRAGLFERELRTSYLGAKDSYYAEYIDLVATLHRRHPGEHYDALLFHALERRRGRAMLDRLRATWQAGDDAALSRDDLAIRRQLNYWSWQLWQQADRAPAAAREQRIRGTIDGLLTDYAALDARAARMIPGYEALLRPEPIPLAAVQRDLLDRDTALLHYTLTDERSWATLVTSAGLAVFDLPARREIESRALAFHRLFAPGLLGRTGEASRRREAAALGTLLLGPIAASIDRRRLVVIADGALNYVPFAALVHPLRGEPLVALHEIVTAASATTIDVLRRRAASRPATPTRVAVFADPVYDAADPRVRARGRRTGAPNAAIVRRLSRLPFSRQEAERILSLVPPGMALKALDFDASRRLVTSATLGDYSVLHFGAHAVSEGDLSGVVLSLEGPDGPEDGFLRLHDIYRLRLNASLVVLSGCETGAGRLAGAAEAPITLSQGFLNAGASRVLATRWKVDDEAGATLVGAFFDALLRDGQSPAAALRSAQLAVLKQHRWRDAYYWSGFVLEGDW